MRPGQPWGKRVTKVSVKAAAPWSDLPILPEAFKVRTNSKTKDPLHQALQALVKKAAKVLIATEARCEGELIAREILEHCGYRVPLERVWGLIPGECQKG